MRSRLDPLALTPRTFQILLALAERDLHGLEIMRDVRERTDGRLQLWPGMLYGSLRQLVESGMVVEKAPPRDARPGGGRPRFYGITPLGRRACAAEAERLARDVRTARARNVLGSSGGT